MDFTFSRDTTMNSRDTTMNTIVRNARRALAEGDPALARMTVEAAEKDMKRAIRNVLNAHDEWTDAHEEYERALDVSDHISTDPDVADTAENRFSAHDRFKKAVKDMMETFSVVQPGGDDRLKAVAYEVTGQFSPKHRTVDKFIKLIKRFA